MKNLRNIIVHSEYNEKKKINDNTHTHTTQKLKQARK